MKERLFTIYKRPRDYPDTPFVVRMWKIDNVTQEPVPEDPVLFFESLEAAQKEIQDRQPGAVHLPRGTDDDPVIVESWF